MALYVAGDAARLSAAPDSGREKERACRFPMGSFAIGGSGPARYLTHIFSRGHDRQSQSPYWQACEYAEGGQAAESRCNDPACSTCICYVIKTPIGRPNRATCDLTPAVPRHHLMYVLSPPWPLHPAIASALRILRPQFDGLPVCRVNLEMAQLRCLGALMQPPPQSGLMMERGSRFVES